MMGLDLSTNGLAVDDDWQPLPPAPVQETTTNEYDLPKLTQALFNLPPPYYRDYDKWLAVGMALYGTDPGLLAAWEQFSKQDLTAYMPGVCAQKWATFSRREGGLTAGSIFHWASEAA